MTSPTTPASPTSAEDVQKAALNVFEFCTMWGGEFEKLPKADAIKFQNDAALLARTIMSPSPPAVVGKPTKEALAEWLYEMFAREGQWGWPPEPWGVGSDARRSHWIRTADALLAAPIWPTAEPPATVDARAMAMEEARKFGVGFYREDSDGTAKHIPVDDVVLKPHEVGSVPGAYQAALDFLLQWFKGGIPDGMDDSLGLVIETFALRQRAGSGVTRERDGEREAREKCSAALREKDEAMGELFRRLKAANVDCSDLIS